MAHFGSGHHDRWVVATLDPQLDLRDRRLSDRVKAIQADAVIHLAARTSVSESFRDPDGYFDVNFNGTLNLLRALRTANFRGRFLYVGSGDCYGAIQTAQLPVREDHPLRPRNPYAAGEYVRLYQGRSWRVAYLAIQR